MEPFIATPETLDDENVYHIQDTINYANSLYHNGNFEESQQYLSEAIAAARTALKGELTPSAKLMLANIYNRRAATAFKLQRYEEVLVDAQEMISLGYQLAKAHVRRGRALQALNRTEEARQAFKQACQLSPFNEAYKQYLEELDVATPEPGATPAVPALSKEAELLEQIHESSEAGHRVFFQEDYEQAVSHYTAALQRAALASKSDSDSAAKALQYGLLQRRSQSYIKLHKFDEALADANAMIAMAPTSEKGYLQRAHACVTSAVETLRKGLHSVPTSTSIQSVLTDLQPLQQRSMPTSTPTPGVLQAAHSQ